MKHIVSTGNMNGRSSYKPIYQKTLSNILKTTALSYVLYSVQQWYQPEIESKNLWISFSH